MSTKALIGILLAGTAGIVVFLFVHLSNDSGVVIEPGTAKAACDRAKDDCLPDVKYVDTTGKAWTAESLKGKVVVVNFWATWCHPCQKEIPDLSKIYEKYKDKGVVMLGIMSDIPPPSDSEVLNFASDHEMTYPIVRITPDLNVAFKYPQNLPTTFVFDRGGHQVGHPTVGAIAPALLTSQIDQLVAQK